MAKRGGRARTHLAWKLAELEEPYTVGGGERVPLHECLGADLVAHYPALAFLPLGQLLWEASVGNTAETHRERQARQGIHVQRENRLPLACE